MVRRWEGKPRPLASPTAASIGWEPQAGRRGGSIWIEEREAARWILPEGREEQSMGVGGKTGGSRVGGPELCV